MAKPNNIVQPRFKKAINMCLYDCKLAPKSVYKAVSISAGIARIVAMIIYCIPIYTLSVNGTYAIYSLTHKYKYYCIFQHCM